VLLLNNVLITGKLKIVIVIFSNRSSRVQVKYQKYTKNYFYLLVVSFIVLYVVNAIFLLNDGCVCLLSF